MSATPPPLSTRLRDATREDHVQAERRPFVRDLLAGRLERPAYIGLLRDLHPVYEALEDGLLGAPAGTVPATLTDPALARSGALDADLRHLHGPGWAEELRPTAAAEAYRTHLATLTREAPQRLAAHAYVRYLGDLSGGRAIGRQVARAYDLGPQDGLAFYAFPGLGDLDTFKDAFRAALDGIGRRGDADALVEEARWAFRRNRAIFDDLQTRRESTT